MYVWMGINWLEERRERDSFLPLLQSHEGSGIGKVRVCNLDKLAFAGNQ